MHAFLRGLALVLLCAAWPCAAQSYQDWWWNPAQSGHGLNIGQQDNVLFVSWFTYDEQGQGMWLVTSGALAGKTYSGNWSRTTGPKLGTPFDPSQVATSTVGTVTITFSDLHHAKMDWMVNGKSGSVDLVRETWSPVTLNGSYYGRSTSIVCGALVLDADSLTITVSSPPGAPQTMHVFDVDSHGKSCNFDGNVAKSGSLIHYNGAYTCTNMRGSGTHDTTMLVAGETISIFQSTALSTGCAGTTVMGTLAQ